MNILVIGAGASGLMAARELLKAGQNVTVLEARKRAGGRIHTINEIFSQPTELGAEFIHGNLPLTMQLLTEANISYYPAAGKMYQLKEGKLQASDFLIKDWDLFSMRLQQLKYDMSLSDFLNQNFHEEKYASLCNSVKGYAEGYDTADINRASTIALRDEWLSEDNAPSYRIKNGYGKLINFLVNDCRNRGGIIHFSSAVKKIQWSKGNVKAITIDDKKYEAEKIVITVPLGVLADNAISFSPAIPGKIHAAKMIGFGSVIKVLLEFREPFWKNILEEKNENNNIGFIFSDAMIPTWWTQFPDESKLLTGWLGGPKSLLVGLKSDEEILLNAINSLNKIFNVNQDELKQNLTASKIVNWIADPFTRGSYIYATMETNEARKILSMPVENTLFFSGEALYDGPLIGTVESALASGLEAAKKILGSKV